MKRLLWKLFARKTKCQTCSYLTCISNHSPCYSCYKFNKYVYWDPGDMPESERVLRGFNTNIFIEQDREVYRKDIE